MSRAPWAPRLRSAPRALASWLALGVLAVPLTACSPGGEAGSERAELTVLAAASLTDAYEELAADFEAEHDAEVTFSFGSSTDLAGQAADGAPGDVLSTADAASMALAEDAGVTGEVVEVAANRLVLVTPAGNPAGIEGLADLAGATWVRCADDVPCGRVAVEVLADHGIDAEPASLEEDVRATLDKVTSGEAEAGLVYASDAVAAGDRVTTVAVPGADEHRATYLATVLAQSEAPDLARAWVEHVTSAEGRAVLRGAGFLEP